MVICQKCWKEPATIHLTAIEAGVPDRTHFCGRCGGEAVVGLVPAQPVPTPEDRAALEELKEAYKHEVLILQPPCQLCREARADHHLTEREGNRLIEAHVCRACSHEVRGDVRRAIERLSRERRRRGWADTLAYLVTWASLVALAAAFVPAIRRSPQLLAVVSWVAALIVAFGAFLFVLGRKHARRRSPAPQGH